MCECMAMYVHLEARDQHQESSSSIAVHLLSSHNFSLGSKSLPIQLDWLTDKL